MANPKCERNMKNYMHDNPQLSETNFKKSSSCADLTDCIGPNQEVWVLQCPKGFDPCTLIDKDLGKLKKDKSCKVDLTAAKFKDKISFACLTPEKAAEYEVICDNIKMVKPVGKIIVTQSKNDVQQRDSSSINVKSEPCSDIENNDECSEDVDIQNPISSKKIKKKFNDQKFTIETTVTVENCGDRKKNKKIKQESCEECLPLVPPEPVVPTKKQKKKKSCEEDDLSWLNC